MSKAQIEAMLKTAFEPHYIDVIDESAYHATHAGARESGGGHYQVIIVSEAFHGKTKIERHRMVYEVLKPIQMLIHAIAIYAKTPAEF